jgi:hypothetical protein
VEFEALRAGDSPNSRAAFLNLQRLCESHLSGKYEIEVIDVKLRPELAKVDQILALPTLIRKTPEPTRRVIGDPLDWRSRPPMGTERFDVTVALTGYASQADGEQS